MSTKPVSKPQRPAPPEADDGALVVPSFHAPGALAQQGVVTSIYLDERRLSDWLFEKSSPDAGAFRCAYYLLIHMSEHGPDEITGWAIPRELDDVSRAQRCDRVASQVAEAATPIASGTGSTRPQQFRLAAYLKAVPVGTKLGREQEPEHKAIFLVRPDAQVVQAIQDEASTAASIIGSLTRALTAERQHHSSNLQNVFEGFREENKMLVENLRQFLREKHEDVVKHQELADAQALRHVQVKKSEYEMEVMHKLEVAFIRYLAPVIGKVVEAKMGVAVEQGDHPLLQLAESLSPEQLLRFIDSMTDEQQTMFAQMAGVLVDRMPLEKKERFYQLIQENAAKKAAAAEAAKVTVNDQRQAPPTANKGGA